MGELPRPDQDDFSLRSMEPLLRQLFAGDRNLRPKRRPSRPTAPPVESLPGRCGAAGHGGMAGMELSARDILHLKVGDVLQVNPQLARQVNVRLGELSRFTGRLGTIGGHWAVELTQVVKP